MRALRTAIALLLALGLASPALSDEDDLEKEPDTISLPPDLGADLNDATDVLLGIVRGRHDRAVSASGVPGTQYTIEVLRWRSGTPAGTAPVRVFVLGGLGGAAGKGHLLMPSEGWHHLTVGHEYVIAVRGEPGERRVTSVLRIDDQYGLVDSAGYAYRVPPSGQLVRTSSAVLPSTDLWWRLCSLERRRDPQLPVGDDGLRSFHLESSFPKTIWVLRRAAALSVLGFKNTATTIAAKATKRVSVECLTCRPWAPEGVRPHLAEPWRFTPGAGVGEEQSALIEAAFGQWNAIIEFGPQRDRLFEWDPKPRKRPAVEAGAAMDDVNTISVHPRGETLRCNGRRARGCTYVWVDEETGRVLEIDVHLSAETTHERREFSFVRTLVHELGHALCLGHPCGYLGVMHAAGKPVERPPLEYRGEPIPFFLRHGDLACAAEAVRAFNVDLKRARWILREHLDIGTSNTFHPSPAKACAICRASIRRGTERVRCNSRTPPRVVAAKAGEVIRVVGVHIENCGARPLVDVLLEFRLRPVKAKNPLIRIGRYKFGSPLTTWNASEYEVRVPKNVPEGAEYFVEWSVSHSQPDATPGNNRARLVAGRTAEYLRLLIVR